MSSPPRVTCTRCQADLGEAILLGPDHRGVLWWAFPEGAAEHESTCTGPAIPAPSPTPEETQPA